MKSNEEYVNEWGSRCPYCDSPEVNKTTDIENECDGTAVKCCSCDECGKGWDEKWEMVGVNCYDKS